MAIYTNQLDLPKCWNAINNFFKKISETISDLKQKWFNVYIKCAVKVGEKFNN